MPPSYGGAPIRYSLSSESLVTGPLLLSATASLRLHQQPGFTRSAFLMPSLLGSPSLSSLTPSSARGSPRNASSHCTTTALMVFHPKRGERARRASRSAKFAALSILD